MSNKDNRFSRPSERAAAEAAAKQSGTGNDTAVVDAKAPVESARIRDLPSAETLAKVRSDAKPKDGDYVTVKTVSGGDMRDPDSGQWISGKPTLAPATGWVDVQVRARKLVKVG